MEALQAQPQSSAELAAQLGVSDRHIRRTIADLILSKEITVARDGRNIIYSAAAAVVEEDAASSSITAGPATADNSGHAIADMSAIDCGHSGNPDGTIEKNSGHTEDNGGHDSGHRKKETSKQRHRIAKRDAIVHGPAPFGPQFPPGRDPCTDGGTPLCPQFYAGFERDMIQFVLLDKIFRDLLVTRAEAEHWETRRIRDTVHSTVWIRIPSCQLSMQAGRDTVTFYSAEPGDMSAIAAWVRQEFTVEYADIDNLVSRIKSPEQLSAEELTVVIRHPETIVAIRMSIGKMATNGMFNIQHPSEKIPGLKIYESNGTMRVEFVIHDRVQGLAGLEMRAELMAMMPRIQRTPGLFWEFIQKYYSHLLHPLNIDTGGHEFLQALGQVTDQFADVMRAIADKIPAAAPSPEDLKLRELRDAIEALESSEIGDIIRLFRDMLNAEEDTTKTYLAAWAVWAKRNFRGRITKADIASLLLRANEPIAAPRIADAIEKLQAAGLLVKDPRLEIKFSPDGTAIARKLMARWEGL
jgi:hypothetical protein